MLIIYSNYLNSTNIKKLSDFLRINTNNLY